MDASGNLRGEAPSPSRHGACRRRRSPSCCSPGPRPSGTDKNQRSYLHLVMCPTVTRRLRGTEPNPAVNNGDFRPPSNIETEELVR